jgi:protein gp37
MSDGTAIEWTDATWNVVNGCSVLSPGCTNCYAMHLAGTRLRNHPTRAGLTSDSKAGPVWTGEVRFNDKVLLDPLGWRRPRQIFVCAHGDLFHENVPVEWIVRVYGVAIAAHHLNGHVLQFLTKRADRARKLLNSQEFWDWVNAEASMHIMERVDPLNRRSDDPRATCDEYGPDNPPPGLWLGVSAEDQRRAEERIAHLLATPAAVRWISAEPLLAALELDSLWLRTSPSAAFVAGEVTPEMPAWTRIGSTAIDWIVAGGESGRGARPMHPDWARGLRDQCESAGVPFLFKQWGEWAPAAPGAGTHWLSSTGSLHRGPAPADAVPVVRFGKKAAGRLLDGVQHDGYPA